MLSVGKPMQASQAANYFSNEDYYLKDGKGSWLGRGARQLELSGEVDQSAFHAVCQGIEPYTNEVLIERKTGDDRMGHRAGIDITFSPPKSVSLAALTDPIHQKLHNEAVERVVSSLEQNLVHARITEDGETSTTRTGSMVAAKFDHMTSRELDPQLHSHIFLANMTCHRGKWRATHNDAIYRNQKNLGRLYDNELMHLYKVHGFEVEITNRSKGTWELTAVPPTLIDCFSKRREQVLERIDELKMRQRMVGLYKGKSDTWLAKKAVLDTRAPKLKNIGTDQLNKWWAEDLSDHGYTFETLRHAIESARSTHPKFYTKELADESLRQAAEVLHSRESAFTKEELMHTAMIRSQGEHSLSSYKSAFWSLLEDKHGFVSLGPKLDKHGIEVEMISTKFMLEAEHSVIQQAQSGIGKFNPVTSRGEVEKFIINKELEKTEEMAAAGHLKDGEKWQLSDDQRRYVCEALSGKDNVLLVNGDPGTGKTAAREIIEAFNSEVLMQQGRRQHITLSVSTMGRAAAEISSATGGLADTIDRFLAKDFEVAAPDRLWQMMQTETKTVWLPKGAALEILVDEASMVSSPHFGKLMELAERWRHEFRTDVKITYSGDRKQMPSIGAGKLFEELLNRTSTQKIELKKIIRQKEGTYTREVSVALNHDNDPDRAIRILRDNNQLYESPNRDVLINAAVGKYLTAAESGRSAFIVTPLNSDRKEINSRIRSVLIKSGLVEAGREIEMLSPVSNIGVKAVSADNYTVGQLAVFTGSERRQDGIKYGYEGTITAIDPDKNTVLVNYGNEKNSISIEHNLKKDWNKLSVFDKEKRHFGVGDEVIFSRNHRGIGVNNGDRGRIVEIDGNKLIVERLDGKYKREISVRLTGRNAYKYLDHAYAITVQKSQGATIDEAIAFLYVKPSAVTNSQKTLQEVVGAISKDTYTQLNSTLDEKEMSWTAAGMLNGHQVTIKVGVADIGRSKPELSKVIEVNFINPQALIEDEETRRTMREAGMYFRHGHWMTSLTNQASKEIVGKIHPLNDPSYLQLLRNRIAQIEGKGHDAAISINPKDARDIYEAERKYAEAYFQTFNTMATRARCDFSVFSNDAESLSAQMKRWQHKESTLVEPGLKVRLKGEKRMGQIVDYDEKSDKVAVEYNSKAGDKTVRIFSGNELRDSGGRELYMSDEERKAAGGKRSKLLGFGGISAEYNWASDKIQTVEKMKYGEGHYESIKVGDTKIDSYIRRKNGIFRITRTITRQDGTKLKVREHGSNFAGELFGYRWKSETIKTGQHKGNRKISTVYHFGRKYWGTATYIDWIGDKKIEKWQGRIKGGILSPRRLEITRVTQSEGMTGKRRIMGCLQRRIENLVNAIDQIADKAIDKFDTAQLTPREALSMLKPGRLSRLLMTAEEKHRREDACKAVETRVAEIEFQNHKSNSGPQMGR